MIGDNEKGEPQMIVQAEVDENGVVKVCDPEWRGKIIALSLLEQEQDEFERETDWEAIEKIFEEADTLDFPRRSHEEIIRDLHELRG